MKETQERLYTKDDLQAAYIGGQNDRSRAVNNFENYYVSCVRRKIEPTDMVQGEVYYIYEPSTEYLVEFYGWLEGYVESFIVSNLYRANEGIFKQISKFDIGSNTQIFTASRGDKVIFDN